MKMLAPLFENQGFAGFRSHQRLDIMGRFTLRIRRGGNSQDRST